MQLLSLRVLVAKKQLIVNSTLDSHYSLFTIHYHPSFLTAGFKINRSD